jgi:UDP-N-acetylmuramate dehydrogenase
MDLKESISRFKENVSLKDYTTFKIGGRASYFFVAENKKEVISAITIAKENDLPFFILGGGSNILVADEGFNGLVIKTESRELRVENSKIHVEAGVLLSKVVSNTLANNLGGLEWAVGIPGTVGGAIHGNTGAFGESISDIVKEVEVLDINELRAKNYALEDCKFGYRKSIFQKNANLVILSAVLEFKKSDQKSITKKMKEFLEHRKITQPNLPSAGSIFKNPHGFSAGELIEKCALKGKTIGKAQISKKHANFIVNLGKATAEDTKKIISFTKQRVKEKFGIELEEEIQYLGF